MDQDTRLQAREHSKAYRDRLKRNPEKLAALNAQAAKRMKAYRERKKARPDVTQPQPDVTPDVTKAPDVTDDGWITISRTPQPESDVTEPDATEPTEEGRPQLGGKHAASATQGELSLSMESLVGLWHDRWAKDERLEERAAIMEFDGGLSRQQAEEAARVDVIRVIFGDG
jgi:hypothetical protein